MTYSETRIATRPMSASAPVRRRGKRTQLFAIALLLPAFAVLAALIFYPLVTVLDLSFRVGSTMNFLRIGEQPYGVDNYLRLLTDSQFWNSVRVSALYLFGSLVAAFAVGLWTALLLNRKMPARRWLRTVVLLPWAVPGVVAAIIFTWMFDGSYGFINAVLRTLHLSQADTAWLMNSGTAIWVVILPTVWKAYPLITLTILAALQTIPDDLYEAGAIDGANRTQLFRYITLPAIASASLMSVLISALWISMDIDIIFGSTAGGPADATTTLPLFIYNEAFQYFRMGTAAAGGVMMMIAVAAISGLTVSLADRQKF
jgi:multiple sugar transport system permease protein